MKTEEELIQFEEQWSVVMENNDADEQEIPIISSGVRC